MKMPLYEFTNVILCIFAILQQEQQVIKKLIYINATHSRLYVLYYVNIFFFIISYTYLIIKLSSSMSMKV